MSIKSYLLKPALKEHIEAGFIWIVDSRFKSRDVIKVINRKQHKKIYCEALQIDNNFLKSYNGGNRISINLNNSNVNPIVMNMRYRRLLGDLNKNTEYDLEIVKPLYIWGAIRAALQHPQLAIRISVWLGIISVVLGVLGIIIAFRPCVP